MKGIGKEGCSELTYLPILINLWPGNCKTQLERMNQKVDENNGKALNKGNLQYRNVLRFSSNEFWKNIGCLVLARNFCIGGSRL